MTVKSKRKQALNNQKKRLQKRLERLKALSNRFSHYRLLVFFGGMTAGILCYYLVGIVLGWSLLFATLVVFNIVACFHRRVNGSIYRHEIWLQLKSTQLARMSLDWPNIPFRGAHEPDASHPFEGDLDLTGKKSLHQLMDVAISEDGSRRLRHWLLNTKPDSRVIQNRQALVRELTPLARFRDKLLLAFNLLSKEPLESQKLLSWLHKPNNRRYMRIILTISTGLAGLNIILFILHLTDFLAAYWIISLTVYFVIYFMNFRLEESLFEDSNIISDELQKLREVLIYLERYPYRQNKNLLTLCQPFLDSHNAPSKHFKKITRLSFAVGLRMNPLVRGLLNAAIPWDFLLVSKINKIRIALAKFLPDWLDVLFEFEALISLANFAYLNPEYVFPELLTKGAVQKSTIFHAENLGHPLISDRERVCNDFVFERKGDIALITGSNMSGKSTFLKTIGVNLCLAFAGGPVNASSMQTALFRLFTCVQIHDSVTEGFSFFYAEVKRLKCLLDGLRRKSALPLLFLIDEIFKGTNNRERLMGSRSYILALAGENGLGAISTHDLELTRLSEIIPSLTNYHFKEEVQNGKMVFDYTLRLGPCPTTNALKIMRMEGLPVEGVPPTE